jgi:hypothetical protein
MKASQIFVISVEETSMLPWIYLLDLEIVCDEINKYIYMPSYRLSTRQGSASKAEPWTSCQTSQKRDVAGKSFLNSPHRRMPYRTINQVDRISCQHLGSWRLFCDACEYCAAHIRHMPYFEKKVSPDSIDGCIETRWDEPQRSYWVSKDQLEDPTPGFHWAKQIWQIYSKSL